MITAGSLLAGGVDPCSLGRAAGCAACSSLLFEASLCRATSTSPLCLHGVPGAAQSPLKNPKNQHQSVTERDPICCFPDLPTNSRNGLFPFCSVLAHFCTAFSYFPAGIFPPLFPEARLGWEEVLHASMQQLFPYTSCQFLRPWTRGRSHALTQLSYRISASRRQRSPAPSEPADDNK